MPFQLSRRLVVASVRQMRVRIPCSRCYCLYESCRSYRQTPSLFPPRKLSQAKQKPLFPGMYRTVRLFDGEHTYHYGRHTYTIMRESLTFAIIPLGCVAAYAATYFDPFAAVPLELQGAYLVFLLIGSRLYARGRSCRTVKDLTGRHAVVTGGTSGIGKETAARLAAAGADVTVLARSSSHAEAAITYIRRSAHCEGQVVQFTPLDLSDFLAVRDYCRRLRHTNTRLDILVNCAGVMHQRQVMSRCGDDEQLAVNLLGPYLLTEGLLPLIAESGGRIVNVSCSAHVAVRGNIVQTYLSGRGVWSPRVRGKFDGLEQYGLTKLGCIYHAQELASRSYHSTTKGNASFCPTDTSHPSLGSSAINKGSNLNLYHYKHNSGNRASNNNDSGDAGGDDEAGAPNYTTCVAVPGGVVTGIYRYVPLAATFRWFRWIYLLFMRSAREGSQTVVDCCLRDDIVNGGYYQNCRYAPSGLSAAACNIEERKNVLTWVRRKMQPYMQWDR
ncbi:short-chain dehydrogenase, putative [Trypanosoma brucei gambiense DAL972]|uniref:Short-chain dehydrogenase, putative n=1 Tax=Trypanosoma brucei gambiense (strain MHOM/CI/86/DAL972) TaxID=679716 RepID=C9ZWC1_TRYB9|nr:short-chain dehydrogenase, putative [Trypanosoma brucei gambiense DAL972]CBH13710.1 short-chain dehydrogenase, putative [Trypanosoma brucei gambiense DAL972]|eukprot:XP_011775986.1 short-chain dehydrogenase, putative [Trypanosoma brucei gambiense DAL972]